MLALKTEPKRVAPPSERVLLSGLLGILLSLNACACPICLDMPTETVADHLIRGEVVVLARENPDVPFTYSLVDVLKGESPTGAFGLFVDSATRRRLSINPEEAVILVETKEGAWQRLGIADKDYQQVVKRILLFGDGWTAKGDLQHRHQFFLSLFGHRNRSISELAYLELGRAPYETIRKAAEFVSRDDLRPILEKREYFQWRPLAILLLAQNASQQERKRIKSSFESCLKYSLTTHLAAWTTAYIEVAGVEAVDRIETVYLRDTNRSAEEIEAVLKALAIHSRSKCKALAERIVNSYDVARHFHQELAESILTDR